MNGRSKAGRFPEIDVFRGVAVLFMVLYHVLFDLYTFGLLEVPIQSGPGEVIADVTAAGFFSIVGISLRISFSRAEKGGLDRFARLKKYSLRGIKLLLWGGIITGVTYLLYPKFPVIFGALQFIGTSVLFGYLLLELTLQLNRLCRILSFGLLSLAVFLVAVPARALSVDHGFLVWLGPTPAGFQSLDYFPLLPWFGFVLGGLVLGELFYPAGTRRKKFYEVKNPALEFLGRNALVVYFLHQPLIYLGIFLFKFWLV